MPLGAADLWVYVSPARESMRVSRGHCCAPLPGTEADTERGFISTAAERMNKYMNREDECHAPRQPELSQQGSALNIPGARVRVLTRHS